MGAEVNIRSLDLEETCYWASDFRTTGAVKECRDGRVWDYGGSTAVPTDEKCSRCKGTGVHPTELGWQVIEFVRDYRNWER